MAPFTKRPIYSGEIPRDLFFEIAQGQIEGLSSVQKFGRNLDLDANVAEEVWAAGGFRAYLSAAETMTIVSTSTDDTNGGSGAHAVLISGLDAQYDEIEETVTLTGTTPVVTTNSFLRVNRVRCLAVGSTEANVGTITVDPTSSGSGSRQASIDVGEGQTQLTHFTVPNNRTGYIVGIQASLFIVGGASTRACRVQMYVRNGPDQSWRGIKELSLSTHGTATTPAVNFTVPDSLPEKSDIKFEATADVNNSGLYLQFNIILVEN